MPEPQTIQATLFADWYTLSRTEQWRTRQRARYMRLRPASLRTLSPAAQDFADAVLNETIIPHKAASLTTPLRPSTRQALAEALSAWLANLLFAAAWGNWTAQSTRRERFTKLAVGWQAFMDCKAALEQAGLIVSVKGLAKSVYPVALSPIFRPTPALLEIAARHGVTAGGIADHFALEGPEDPETGLMVDHS